METQYRCHGEERRAKLIADLSRNGIDYLEVVDKGPSSALARQQLLLVRCFKKLPETFSAVNVVIDGGVRRDDRINPVRVLWAARADKVTVPPATDAENNYCQGEITDREWVLVVRTNSAGDFSRYTLRLVESAGTDAPPQNFDEHFSAVEFSFKVQCESDFDCRAEQKCIPETPAPIRIDYLSKDYSSFRRLMLDRMAVVAPDWKERNPADVWVATVEVLAYAADQLSYFQDAVATEAYVGTARQRISARRHGRLLDYRLHDGCNARAWVCLGISAGSGAEGAVLPAGTGLLTHTGKPDVVLKPDAVEVAISGGALYFETMHDVQLFAAHSEMRFYTWGNKECCLPKGATRAALAQDTPQGAIRHLAPGDVLIFEEVLEPAGSGNAAGDPLHRQALRLTRVRYTTDPLFNNTGVVEIEWGAEDALERPLCISTVSAGAVREPISVARGNVALADHGRRVREEKLPDPSAPASPRRLRLERTGVTFAAPFDARATRDKSARAALLQTPADALAAAELRKSNRVWTVQRDLLSSGRFSTEFVVEMEEDGVAYLRFGDGVNGERPEEALTATYRVGNGSAGNIGAEALAHVLTGFDGIVRVRNPLPASGGSNPEPLAQFRLLAPQAFRRQERAVTEDDYARAAERHPGVQRAAATLRWTGSWHTMFVTVDRKEGRAVTAEFEQELREFLERFRVAGYDLEVDGPQYVALDILFTICVAPGYYRSEVKRALLAEFSNKLLPDGRRGFFHPDNFTFGQPLFLSQMMAAAMHVPGVSWVDSDVSAAKRNRFQRLGRNAIAEELESGEMKFGRLEIARLDNDPSQPELGRLDFAMEGGL